MRKDPSTNHTRDDKEIFRERSHSNKFQAAGFAAVAISMVLLFIPPPSTYFVYGVFVATPVMMLVAFWLTGYKNLFNPSAKSITIGLISALLLYLVFLGGNFAVQNFGYLVGLHSTSEETIYSTIAAHPLYLQVAILIFDAFGFESYFRGTLQNFFMSRISINRGKAGSIFLAALCDSLVHILSFNPLWVVTTFIADSVWGLTFYSTRDLGSNVTSHLIWDLVIFIVAPIR